jgi:hypothetical protein
MFSPLMHFLETPAIEMVGMEILPIKYHDQEFQFL